MFLQGFPDIEPYKNKISIVDTGDKYQVCIFSHLYVTKINKKPDIPFTFILFVYVINYSQRMYIACIAKINIQIFKNTNMFFY